jgi:hypothetical protein
MCAKENIGADGFGLSGAQSISEAPHATIFEHAIEHYGIPIFVN